MAYEHIFFDLDHTLWDFETNARLTLEELFVQHQLETRGVPSFDHFHQTYTVHNDKLWKRFRNGFIKREELRWKRMWLTLLDYKISDELLAKKIGEDFLAVLPTKASLFPGTVEILDYLENKNYPLHLITNGFETTQYLKLKHAGIDQYFTHVITSEMAGSLKPHREIFDYALQKVNTTAEKAIMIGDTLEVDILGAQNVGMDQVYFNPAVPPNGIQPTYVIQHLLELKNIL
jgi:putative hydrolase of the HAD superfamily